jgi:spore coat polysaccharide biosynthesis protein SpsF
MKVGAIVLARLDSRRLPAKALKPVRGTPLIGYALSLCRRIEGVDCVAIACTDRAVDDPLERLAREEGVQCVRGSTDDVAGRFLQAMNELELDAAVRMNGDSPLNSAPLLARAVALFREERWDLVSNVPGRTYPYGMSAEVVDRRAFARACASMDDAADREHVTKYLYDHPEAFRIHPLRADAAGWHGIQLAVDDEHDLARFEWILENISGPPETAEIGELVELAGRFDQLNQR